MQPIRVALVGLGHMAHVHMSAISQTSDLELVAACDVDPTRSDQLKSYPNVHFCCEIDELLSRGHVDVVVIATPPDTHVSMAKKVVESGYACAIEKPMCVSHSELDLLMRLHRKKGTLLYSMLHTSFDPAIEWWMSHAMDYGLNVLTAFQVDRFDPYVEVDGLVNPEHQSLMGSWIDSGINALASVARFLDELSLKLETAAMTRIPGIGCSEVQGNATFTFHDSHRRLGFGVVRTDWSLNRNWKGMRLYYGYDDAVVEIDETKQTIRVIRDREFIDEMCVADPKQRMNRHYGGVYEDLVAAYRTRHGNLQRSLHLHHLMLDAWKHT